MSKEPDFIYDPEEWDATYEWSDRDNLEESFDYVVGPVKRFCTLTRGPDKWLARVVVSLDERGDPDETELRWFDTEEAARKAVAGRPLAQEIER